MVCFFSLSAFHLAYRSPGSFMLSLITEFPTLRRAALSDEMFQIPLAAEQLLKDTSYIFLLIQESCKKKKKKVIYN